MCSLAHWFVKKYISIFCTFIGGEAFLPFRILFFRIFFLSHSLIFTSSTHRHFPVISARFQLISITLLGWNNRADNHVFFCSVLPRCYSGNSRCSSMIFNFKCGPQSINWNIENPWFKSHSTSIRLIATCKHLISLIKLNFFYIIFNCMYWAIKIHKVNVISL